MREAAFIAAELVFLAMAHLVGGPWWTAVGAVACVVQVTGGPRAASIAPLFPALAWAVAAQATGNRELYFPFAMHLAAATLATMPPPAPRSKTLAAMLVPATFLIVRWLQAATPRVLVVETVATGVVMATAAALCRWLPGPAGRWVVPIAAAILACVCLAL